jgi:phosphatidyl-myo-inositol dimannoside synthase
VIEHLRKNKIEVSVLEINKLSFYSFIRVRRRAGNCNAIHALDIWPHALYGWFAVIGTKKKLVLSGVGTYSVAPLTKWWQKNILKIIFRRVAKIVCISDYTRDQIKDLVPTAPVETVLMGLTKLPSAVSKSVSQSPLILTVGAVKERKGQLDTFKAILLLKEKYPNILYMTIGSLSDTTYVSEIKKLGNERHIQMIENVTDSELAQWYATANVFCLNSNNSNNHFEGFGLVILEAGQFGLPSVGSSGCGIESAIDDGLNGYLSKQGDILDIADKVKKALLLDKRKIKDFTQKFDWDKTVQSYAECYLSK